MSSPSPRNPGPSWGYAFLLWAERTWPRALFRPVLAAGTAVGMAFMPRQRRESRAYLRVVLGRAPRLHEVWRHFHAFAEFLVLKLRVGRGGALQCRMEPDHRAAFEALVRSDRPALFGTFHFGCSDLLGYVLSDWGRAVSVLRTRVGNSADTQLLGQRFGDKVSFLWVNDPANFLYDLKDALQAGTSLALKCDRLESTLRTEAFEFLGARRLFPFAIYHLAVLFDRPVVFCLGLPGAGESELRIVPSPVFWPDPARGRRENLAAARGHFQAVLDQLAALVRAHPFMWFNFLPLNPVAPPASPP